MSIENQHTIKELRAKKNKTQVEVASDLGISVQTYNAWENNFGMVKLSKAKAIANYFDVSLSEIFFD